MMKTPSISIILPVFHGDAEWLKTMESIRQQAFADIELVCIAREAESAWIQKAAGDAGLSLLIQENDDAGSAKNSGLKAATGEYVLFAERGDILLPGVLETLLRKAEDRQADITVCDFLSVDSRGREKKWAGIHPEWLPKGTEAFCYRDCPDYITRVLVPSSGNKLYRRAFLQRNGIGFEEGACCPGFAFDAVCAAAAETIAYVSQTLVRTPTGRDTIPEEGLRDVQTAILHGVEKICTLPHREKIQNAIISFVVDGFVLTMVRYVRDFGTKEAAAFYQSAHEEFNRDAFSGVKVQTLHSQKRYLEFLTVRRHDYETMKKLWSRKIIVSLTSYPRRIGAVATTLETIFAQTKKPKEIILWLAPSQFPGQEADLPKELQDLIQQKKLTVRWCVDIMGHKKYFYALQEYTEDVVVTIDDDLLYAKDTLATLYASYLLYPEAVSTMRTHLVMISEEGKVLPYNDWVLETNSCVNEPSMQLMASGGAGDLYPPNLYRKEFFDLDVIERCCPWADNLWVKMMEAISDVPVVLARPSDPLQFVEDTQEETLFEINGRQKKYDDQMQKTIQWTDEVFGEGALVRKLTSRIGTAIVGVGAVAVHVDREREQYKRKALQLEKKLKEAESLRKEAERFCKETEAKLEQSLAACSRTEAERVLAVHTVEKTKAELDTTRNQLQQSRAEQQRLETSLRQARERIPIGNQLKEVGQFLRERKDSGGWRLKYLVYLLAWVPEKLLTGMMFYLKNGMRQTMKKLLKKQ